MSDIVYQSPRGSLRIGLDAGRWSMRTAELAPDWLAAMQDISAQANGLPRVGAIANGSIQEGRFVAGGPIGPTRSLKESPPTGERGWTTLTAELAEVASAADARDIRCGPIAAGQIRVGEEGPLWLGFGTTSVAYEHDRNLRGATFSALVFETTRETLMGEPADTRTDTWHLAAFLFRGLTNASPVPGNTSFEHLANVHAGALRDPRRAGVSDAVSELLIHALGPREARPTAAEFVERARRLFG